MRKSLDVDREISRRAPVLPEPAMSSDFIRGSEQEKESITLIRVFNSLGR
jgi:hypothetical protein